MHYKYKNLFICVFIVLRSAVHVKFIYQFYSDYVVIMYDNYTLYLYECLSAHIGHLTHSLFGGCSFVKIWVFS